MQRERTYGGEVPLTKFEMCQDGYHNDCKGHRKKIESGIVLFNKVEDCSCFCHTPGGKQRVRRIQKMEKYIARSAKE